MDLSQFPSASGGELTGIKIPYQDFNYKTFPKNDF